MDILIILILFNYYLYLIQSNNICRYYYSLCRLHQNNHNLNLNFRKFSKSNRTIHPNSLQIWLLQNTAKSDAFNPYKFGHPYVLTFVFHRPSTSTRFCTIKAWGTRNVKMLDAMNMRDAKTGELLPLGCCMQVTTRAAIINWK